MNLFKQIFATPDIVKEAVTGIKQGADKLFLTQEERADFSQAYNDYVIRYMEATQPMNLSRRFLAMQIGTLWSIGVVIAFCLFFFAPNRVADFIDLMKEVVNPVFILVSAFYFVKGISSQFIQKGKG